MSHRMIFSEVLKLPGDEQNHLAEEALKSWENLPSAAGYTGTSLYRKKEHGYLTNLQLYMFEFAHFFYTKNLYCKMEFPWYVLYF